MPQILASIISGIVEVIFTHPIDNVKTQIQNNQKNKTKIHITFNGFSTRLIGVVPMRFLFWNSLDYFKTNNFNVYSSSILTAIIQTTIDYPIEQIKTQQIINNKKIRNCFQGIDIYKASFAHLSRNVIFTTCFSVIIQQNLDSFYYGAFGGLVGSFVTQPLDTLKTWYQSGRKYYPTHWKLKHYMTGWHYRCSGSFISMNIGWVLFHRLKNIENHNIK